MPYHEPEAVIDGMIRHAKDALSLITSPTRGDMCISHIDKLRPRDRQAYVDR